MNNAVKHLRIITADMINLDNMSFESIKSFKYLGSAVNQNNKIEEEIKERLIAGNKAFYANQKMFQNELL
jgi:hypothetical protein